jgi:hypothetical protein
MKGRVVLAVLAALLIAGMAVWFTPLIARPLAENDKPAIGPSEVPGRSTCEAGSQSPAAQPVAQQCLTSYCSAVGCRCDLVSIEADCCKYKTGQGVADPSCTAPTEPVLPCNQALCHC